MRYFIDNHKISPEEMVPDDIRHLNGNQIDCVANSGWPEILEMKDGFDSAYDRLHAVKYGYNEAGLEPGPEIAEAEEMLQRMAEGIRTVLSLKHAEIYDGDPESVLREAEMSLYLAFANERSDG